MLLKDRIIGGGDADLVPTDSTAAGIVADSTLVDSTIATIGGSPEPLAEYNNLMKLRKRLIQIYTDGKIHDYSPAEIDSILQDLIAQVDTLAVSQQRYIRKINDQTNEIRMRDNTITGLNTRVTELEENISTLQSSHQQELAQKDDQTSQRQLKLLADTFEAMDPESAVEKMLALPDEKIISILKLMSERKRAKLMQVLPNPRANMIVKKMTETQ